MGRRAPGTLRPRERTDRRAMDETMIVRITGTDSDGEALARPVDWAGSSPPPTIVMAPERRGVPALAPGDRVLARLTPSGRGNFEGRTVKRIDATPGRVLGIFRPGPSGGPARLVPTDRRSKAEWTIPPGQDGGAQANEIVLATPLPQTGYGLKPARVMERLGQFGDASSVSLLCIATHGIPDTFPAEAVLEAESAGPVPLGRRTDLRDMPLITIDGQDARDFDDAVFADADGAGWRLVVAIADVAHYVRPGSALDNEAWNRGNSVYFPDRVVPMLPEALSNGWCSLRPNEDRGCLFVEMRIGPDGEKSSHRFGRGLMRSAARLTYEQVQDAADAADEAALPPGLLLALYGAFRALLAARQLRGTLDLDLPERKVTLDAAGQVAEVAPRPRLDSHRLIEEFMVLANVSAAEELERLRRPCLYRVHAPPSDEKLNALRDFLRGLDVSLPIGREVRPGDLARVLERVAGSDEALLVNEVMLRSQSQAEYSPENTGHFGLALARYAHFTSPIRRYADLLVHRSLVSALDPGPDELSPNEAAGLADTAAHVTATERRAALAERDAVDRYLSAYMADKVGARFAARITGVGRFGLFVTLAATGASGLVPISTLGHDFWVHDEPSQALVGRATGIRFQLAQRVEVELTSADPITGGLVFSVLGAARDLDQRHGHHRDTAAAAGRSGKPPVARR